MLTITLTPTMITFKELSDAQADDIVKTIPANAEMKYNEKNGYFVKGSGQLLYQVLMLLSYTYDVEIV